MGGSGFSYAKMAKITGDSGYAPVFMPELFSTSVVIGASEVQPLEPNIGEVDFQALPDLTNITERIDRLIHGITKDIAPEYDYYGYEIRRYMAHVGNVDIFESDENLVEKIKNVRKASVIAEYWKDHLESEIKEIEGILEKDKSTPFSDRTAFKQNKLTVRTFLIVLHGWLDTNERFLMHIYENPFVYQVFYPEVIISGKSRIEFYNAFLLKQAKLKDLKNYTIFAMMVY